MKHLLGFAILVCLGPSAQAQRVLSLDSCRALALRNNKELSVSRIRQDIATQLRKSARTKYLPHVNALGGYLYSSREISILNDDQKAALPTMGTTMGTQLQSMLKPYMAGLPAAMQAQIGKDLTTLAGGLNGIGQQIVNDFHTDTRHAFAGSVMLTQPVFMGGAIVAMNKMADIGEDIARNMADGQRQSTLYNIDQVYWQVVSLYHKQQLAQGYLELVKKLNGDVQKMIKEGVATRSEGLSVAVKVNEAEMSLIKVNDGLVLSKMLLCQLCGLPVSEEVTLADENDSEITTTAEAPLADMELAASLRPELRMLQNVVDLSKQGTRMLKAGHLPQVLLVGGYTVTNPNLYNGFQRKFGGMWNVGVMVRVPIWNWGDVAYKVRASKGATTIATLQLDDAREKIELQLNQSEFKVREAKKKLEMARTSTERAEENLRTANLGFKEGVISTTTVMEAQTAWLQAQSQKIDAEIDVKLSHVNLQKAMGTLY